jgi:transmembrane sensor
MHFDQVLEEQSKIQAIGAEATGEEPGPLDEAPEEEEGGGAGNYFYRVAATLVFLLSFTALSWYFVRQYQESDQLAAAAVSAGQPALVKQVAPRGNRPTFTLHDGSIAHLNAASRITYPDKFSAGARQVALEGQAYFDVERDETRPFLISTQGLTVEVLGTSFDVKAYPNDPQVTVTVESGKVKVYHPAAPDQAYILTKNQQLVWDKASAAFAVAEVEAGEKLAWRYGVLHFDQTPVAEVERLLERWYNVDVVIADAGLYARKITGSHKNESLESVLKSLSFALNAQFTLKGDTVKISRDR